MKNKSNYKSAYRKFMELKAQYENLLLDHSVVCTKLCKANEELSLASARLEVTRAQLSDERDRVRDLTVKSDATLNVLRVVLHDLTQPSESENHHVVVNTHNAAPLAPTPGDASEPPLPF